MRKPLVLALAVLLGLAGCSSLRFPGVYRIDIPQGNFVTSDMIARLEPGMTPEQVRYVLGTPMLVDPFTPGVWFYLMTWRPGEGETVTQNIIVHFDENGAYSHFEGEVIPDLQRRTQAPRDRELHERARRQKEEAEKGNVPDPEPIEPEANYPIDTDPDL